jgi:hypothetical protein
MTRRRKIIVWVAIILGLPIVTMAVLVLVGMTDESPPDTSDLAVVREDIAPDENGCLLLAAAGKLAVDPDPTGQPLDYIDWPQDVVDKALADNAAAFEQLRKAEACPHFQRPPSQDATAWLEYEDCWPKLSRLVCLRASSLFRKGQEAEAMDEALRLLRLASRMQAAKGHVMTYMHATGVAGAAEERLQEFAERSRHLDAARLKAVAADMGNCPVRPEDFANALRTSYEVNANTVDAIAEGRISGRALVDLSGEPYMSFFDMAGPYWLKPNTTKRMFAETTRSQIAALALPWPDCKAMLQEERERKEKDQAALLKWGFAPMANRTGRLLCYNLAIAGSAPRYDYARDCSALGMAQLIVALKAYKVEKGQLPEKIEDLVPEYLKALPLDGFDGKPLRYSREKKVVYSVGEDGKDEGGMTKEEMRAWAKEHAPGYYDQDNPDSVPGPWALPNPSVPLE